MADGTIQQRACTQATFLTHYRHEGAHLCRSRQAVATRCEKRFLINWEAQHQALDILVGHLEGLLTREGVTRIATAEQPFDPTTMMAVATEPDPTRPPQTVVEEVADGYLRDGELLRAAQVKVTL